MCRLPPLLFVAISSSSRGEIEEEEGVGGGFCAEFCPLGVVLACSCSMAGWLGQERTMFW